MPPSSPEEPDRDEEDQVAADQSPWLNALVWGMSGPRSLETAQYGQEESESGQHQGMGGGGVAAANLVQEWWLRGWEIETAGSGPPARVIVSKQSTERNPSCRFGVELWQAGEGWVPRRLLVISERGAIVLESEGEPNVSLALVQRDSRAPKAMGLGFEIEHTFWSPIWTAYDEAEGYEFEQHLTVGTVAFWYAWAELHKWPHLWDQWLLSVPEFPDDAGCEFKATITDVYAGGTYEFHFPVLGFLRAIRALRGCAAETCLATLARAAGDTNYTCNLKLALCPQYTESKRRRGCG